MTLSTTPHFRPSEEIGERVASLELDDEIIAGIGRALSEDIGTGDVTTNCIVVLIKNNHIDYAGSLSGAVELVGEGGNELEIEVEARDIKEVQEALSLGIKRILLDNMSIDDLRQTVQLNAGRARLSQWITETFRKTETE